MNGFNNGYYAAYQPQTGILWVNGIEGAKSYPVAPGNSVWLMDSGDDSVFYIKSVDASGMPQPLRIFEYKERKEEAPKADYVTKEELEKALASLKNNKNYKENKK